MSDELAGAIERIVDSKIKKAMEGGPQTVLAEYRGTDSQGKAWAVIAGATDATPISSSSVEAAPGDTVSLTIADGRATMTANLTDKSAGVSSVAQASGTAAEAKAGADGAMAKASSAQKAAGSALDAAGEAQRMADRASAQASAARSSAESAGALSQAAQESAAAAETAASEAKGVAEATSQHFWNADDGAHITDVTRLEWEAAAASDFPDLSDQKPYHNALWTNVGMLFRSALNHLVSITRSAIAFFDGYGNDASNIVARFGADGVQLGKDSGAHTNIDSDGMTITTQDGTVAFEVSTDETRNVTVVSMIDGSGSFEKYGDGGLVINSGVRGVHLTLGGIESAEWPPTTHYGFLAPLSSELMAWGTSEVLLSATIKEIIEAALAFNTVGSASNPTTSLSINGTGAFGDEVTISSSNINRDGADPTSVATGKGVMLVDEDGEPLGRLDTQRNTAGRQWTRLVAYNEGAGTQIYNILSIGVDKDGTRAYSVSDPAAFRNALGASAGVFPLSAGGTGQSDTSAAALPLSSGVTAYSGQTPHYRKWGNVVSVSGAVSPAAAVEAGGTLQIATLPAGYRPPQRMDFLCQGSGGAQWLLTANPNGSVVCGRYRHGDTNAAMSTSTWLAFAFTFLLA